MKKIFAICAAALLALAWIPESGAQNILGRLADRARNAAENAVGNKIESAVTNAVDKAFDPKTASGNQQGQVQRQQAAPARGTVSYDAASGKAAAAPDKFGEYDGIKEFVDALADINYRKDNVYNMNLDANEATMNMEFKSVSDVVKILPALPTADQIINLDPSFMLDVRKCSKAASDVATAYSMLQANAVTSPKSAGSSMSASRQAAQASNAMQILAVMKKHGIDPETATEAQMEEFMMKAIASGEIQIAPGKGQAFDMNYSEKQEKDIDSISAKLDAIMEKSQGFIAAMQFFTSQSDFCKELDAIYNESVNSWTGSSAYKKVYAIEKDIDKRAMDYVCALPAYNKGEAVEYPSFWVQGRKQENAIIREYNEPYLALWLDKIQSPLTEPISCLKELEAVDADLEAAFPDKTDISYTIMKGQIGSTLVHLSSVITNVMEKVYSAPVINSVAERNTVSIAM